MKNDQGRFAPEFDDNDTCQAQCAAVLYCIGQKVDWRQLLTGTAVTFNPNGTAQVDPVTYQTAEPASSPAATLSPARSSPLTPLPPVRRAPSPCTGSSRRPP
ncbi:MAG: hypothetical protein ACLR5H_04315 [Oscillospiraceae bacterium]